MKWLQKIFFSMGSAVVSLALFAAAIAFATFIENDFGSEAAGALVYRNPVFEILVLLLGVNLSANIVRHRLWRKGKKPVLIFHASLILIYLGAGITRYAGYEGIMRIREGETSSSTLSAKTVLRMQVESGPSKIVRERPLVMTPLTKRGIRESIPIDGNTLEIAVTDFIPRAVKTIAPDPFGRSMIHLAVFQDNRTQDIILAEGEIQSVPPIVFAFEAGMAAPANAVMIYKTGSRLSLVSDFPMERMTMADEKRASLDAMKPADLRTGTVYSIRELRFVLKNYEPKARLDVLPRETEPSPGDEDTDAILATIRWNDIERRAALFGCSGQEGAPVTLLLEDVRLQMAYGSRRTILPFALKLMDFEVERYPGSMKPSSFSSDVIILDKEREIKEPYRIYMNHILRYRGYRFYQADYDEDELGSVLTVTRDPGMFLVYLGFILMIAGLLFTLGSRGSRFRELGKKGLSSHASRFWMVMLAAAFLGWNGSTANAQTPELTLRNLTAAINREHLGRFSNLPVQNGGRIEPVSTLAHKLAYDLTGSPHLPGVPPTAVILGIWSNPDAWRHAPLILVKDAGIRSVFGLPEKQEYASLNAFYEPETGRYRLGDVVRALVRKPPDLYSPGEKALLELDGRISILNEFLDGKVFRVFPLPGDPSHRWTWAGEKRATRTGPDAFTVSELADNYRNAVKAAMAGNTWTDAESALNALRAYQERYGKDILRSESGIRAEVLYNALHLFERLFPWCFFLGVLVLAWKWITAVRPSFDRAWIRRFLFILVFVIFALQTFGLILRWIASGHAPWTNKYESMVFIGWATLMAGMLFSRRSPFVLAASSLLSGLILMAASMPWMDPAIGTLPPVLKSLWLVIHVSVITSSYGFLGVAALVSFMMLVLYIFRPGKNGQGVASLILQTSWIHERMLMCGVILLCIGNIFGSVWANESWGRYWGWDPKEAWTLVMILVYTAVLHLRLVHGLRRLYFYHVSSLFAFGTVIMTYFGVNFYLSGLHSYAQGDPLPVPVFVYIILAVILAVIAAGVRNNRLSVENTNDRSS